MSSTVCGSLMRANGQPTSLYIEAPLIQAYLASGEEVTCKCKIIEKHIFLEFFEDIQEANISEELINELFRISKHIVDAIVLAQATYEGKGLLYTLDFCRLSTGQCLAAPIDYVIDKNEGAKLELQDFFQAAQIPEIKYALRDFNQGLCDRENCPMLFRRTIETLAMFICETNESKGIKWDVFCDKTGISSEENDELFDITKSIMHPHRHGNHIFFTKEQHLKMMNLTRSFLLKSIKFILQAITANTFLSQETNTQL